MDEESEIPREDLPAPFHTTPLILGYYPCICGCGQQVLEQTYHATSGLSMECFLAGARKELHEIEVLARGKRIVAKIPDSRQDKGSKRYPGKRSTKLFVQAAQRRAMKRLKNLFPDEYDFLYAEERHRIGLPPIIRHERGYLTAAAVKTKKVAKAYARTVNQGAQDA